MHQVLQCTICSSAFNSQDKIPKSLICGHSICQYCLQKEYKKGIECPSDQIIDTRKQDQIPCNYSLFEVLDLNSSVKHRVCKNHREAKITLFCFEDEMYCCDMCQKQHKNHNIKVIDEAYKEVLLKCQKVNLRLNQQRETLMKMKNGYEDQLNNICREQRMFINDVQNFGNQVKQFVQDNFQRKIEDANKKVEEACKIIKTKISTVQNKIIEINKNNITTKDITSLLSWIQEGKQVLSLPDVQQISLKAKIYIDGQVDYWNLFTNN